MLSTLVDAYETQHHPIDPPDPIEAIKFRMEQQGLTRKDLEGDRNPHQDRRGLEPSSKPVPSVSLRSRPGVGKRDEGMTIASREGPMVRGCYAATAAEAGGGMTEAAA